MVSASSRAQGPLGKEPAARTLDLVLSTAPQRAPTPTPRPGQLLVNVMKLNSGTCFFPLLPFNKSQKDANVFRVSEGKLGRGQAPRRLPTVSPLPNKMISGLAHPSHLGALVYGWQLPQSPSISPCSLVLWYEVLQPAWGLCYLSIYFMLSTILDTRSCPHHSARHSLETTTCLIGSGKGCVVVCMCVLCVGLCVCV